MRLHGDFPDLITRRWVIDDPLRESQRRRAAVRSHAFEMRTGDVTHTAVFLIDVIQRILPTTYQRVLVNRAKAEQTKLL